MLGGYEYNGSHEISALDELQIRAAVADLRQKEIISMVVSGVFSPVNSAQEERARDIIEHELSLGNVFLYPILSLSTLVVTLNHGFGATIPLTAST